MGYTVCFTGHRSIPEEARASLANELDRVIAELYSLGADTFISGGALGFDLIAACRTARFRAENDGVRLVLALPCRDHRALDGLRFAACVQDALFPRGRGSLFGCFLHFGLHAEEKPIHGRARRRLRCVLSAQFRRNGLHRTTRGGEAYSRDKSCARRVG